MSFSARELSQCPCVGDLRDETRESTEGEATTG